VNKNHNEDLCLEMASWLCEFTEEER